MAPTSKGKQRQKIMKLLFRLSPDYKHQQQEQQQLTYAKLYVIRKLLISSSSSSSLSLSLTSNLSICNALPPATNSNQDNELPRACSLERLRPPTSWVKASLRTKLNCRHHCRPLLNNNNEEEVYDLTSATTTIKNHCTNRHYYCYPSTTTTTAREQISIFGRRQFWSTWKPVNEDQQNKNQNTLKSTSLILNNNQLPTDFTSPEVMAVMQYSLCQQKTHYHYHHANCHCSHKQKHFRFEAQPLLKFIIKNRKLSTSAPTNYKPHVKIKCGGRDEILASCAFLVLPKTTTFKRLLHPRNSNAHEYNGPLAAMIEFKVNYLLVAMIDVVTCVCVVYEQQQQLNEQQLIARTIFQQKLFISWNHRSHWTIGASAPSPLFTWRKFSHRIVSKVVKQQTSRSSSSRIVIIIIVAHQKPNNKQRPVCEFVSLFLWFVMRVLVMVMVVTCETYKVTYKCNYFIAQFTCPLVHRLNKKKFVVVGRENNGHGRRVTEFGRIVCSTKSELSEKNFQKLSSLLLLCTKLVRCVPFALPCSSSSSSPVSCSLTTTTKQPPRRPSPSPPSPGDNSTPHQRHWHTINQETRIEATTTTATLKKSRQERDLRALTPSATRALIYAKSTRSSYARNLFNAPRNYCRFLLTLLLMFLFAQVDHHNHFRLSVVNCLNLPDDNQYLRSVIYNNSNNDDGDKFDSQMMIFNNHRRHRITRSQNDSHTQDNEMHEISTISMSMRTSTRTNITQDQFSENNFLLHNSSLNYLINTTSISTASSPPTQLVRQIAYKWPVISLVGFMFLGATGNILVCMAVLRERRLQTATNYFLLSLAVADLLVCVLVMPFGIIYEFYGRWPFDWRICNLWVTCDVLTCSSSILHMCFISVGRYLGIRNPLHARQANLFVSRRAVLWRIAIAWASSALIASPITMMSLYDHKNIVPSPSQCAITNKYFMIFGSLIAFFIPMFVMVPSYVMTVRLLSRRAKYVRNDSIMLANGNSTRTTNNQRTPSKIDANQQVSSNYVTTGIGTGNATSPASAPAVPGDDELGDFEPTTEDDEDQQQHLRRSQGSASGGLYDREFAPLGTSSSTSRARRLVGEGKGVATSGPLTLADRKRSLKQRQIWSGLLMSSSGGVNANTGSEQVVQPIGQVKSQEQSQTTTKFGPPTSTNKCSDSSSSSSSSSSSFRRPRSACMKCRRNTPALPAALLLHQCKTTTTTTTTTTSGHQMRANSRELRNNTGGQCLSSGVIRANHSTAARNEQRVTGITGASATETQLNDRPLSNHVAVATGNSQDHKTNKWSRRGRGRRCCCHAHARALGHGDDNDKLAKNNNNNQEQEQAKTMNKMGSRRCRCCRRILDARRTTAHNKLHAHQVVNSNNSLIHDHNHNHDHKITTSATINNMTNVTNDSNINGSSVSMHKNKSNGELNDQQQQQQQQQHNKSLQVCCSRRHKISSPSLSTPPLINRDSVKCTMTSVRCTTTKDSHSCHHHNHRHRHHGHHHHHHHHGHHHHHHRHGSIKSSRHAHHRHHHHAHQNCTKIPAPEVVNPSGGSATDVIQIDQNNNSADNQTTEPQRRPMMSDIIGGRLESNSTMEKKSKEIDDHDDDEDADEDIASMVPLVGAGKEIIIEEDHTNQSHQANHQRLLKRSGRTYSGNHLTADYTGPSSPAKRKAATVAAMAVRQRQQRQRQRAINAHYSTNLNGGVDLHGEPPQMIRYLGSSMQVRSEQKATKVLGVVFFTFTFCWTPFFAINFLQGFVERDQLSAFISDELMTTFLWLGYISSTINPVIYTVFNRNFRRAFRRLLLCREPVGRRQYRQSARNSEYCRANSFRFSQYRGNNVRHTQINNQHNNSIVKRQQHQHHHHERDNFHQQAPGDKLMAVEQSSITVGLNLTQASLTTTNNNIINSELPMAVIEPPRVTVMKLEGVPINDCHTENNSHRSLPVNG